MIVHLQDRNPAIKMNPERLLSASAITGAVGPHTCIDFRGDWVSRKLYRSLKDSVRQKQCDTYLHMTEYARVTQNMLCVTQAVVASPPNSSNASLVPHLPLQDGFPPS